MAKMVKAADLNKLTYDTSSVVNASIDYIHQYVQYDADILQIAYDVYEDNASLAVALSGTSDKKSKGYKAALRSIQIWKKTDKGPGKPAKGRTDYRTRLVSAVIKQDALPPDSLIAAIERAPGVATVSVTGYVQISNTPAEYRTLHTTFPKNGSDLQDFLEAAVNGDNDQALEQFSIAGGYPAFSLYSSPTDQIVIRFS